MGPATGRPRPPPCHATRARRPVRQTNLDRPDAAATAGVGEKPATRARIPPAEPPRCTRAGGRMRRRRGGMTGREDPGPRGGRAEHPEGYRHPAPRPERTTSRPWFPRRNRGPSLPFTSGRFHALLNSLFKVLFNFPSRYLFAIGLVLIFSLRWSLPPTLGCTPKQPDSRHALGTPAHEQLKASHPLRGTSPVKGTLSLRPTHNVRAKRRIVRRPYGREPWRWASPTSLAVTVGIPVGFFSSAY